MSLSQAPAQSWRWKVRDRELDLRGKTLVMGILNLTPDSFSDGGNFVDPAIAIEQADQLIGEGADIVDIGAETSRPGTSPAAVSDEEEWRRIQPVLKAVRTKHAGIIISIDTYRGATAQQALDAGADVINDIYGLRHSPEIAGLCAKHGAGLLLMHMQGTPETMQANPSYDNVLAEIRNELLSAIDVAVKAGVSEDYIAVDPGLGFGKTVEHNVEVLAGLEYLRLIQRPICVGASRKGFLGMLTGGLPVGEREEATIAAHCAAVLQGAAIIRTHNVKAASRSLAIIDAIRKQAEL